MNCFTIDIRSRECGIDLSKVRMHREGDLEDGVLVIDLGHLEGENTPAKVYVHDHIVNKNHIYRCKPTRWGTRDNNEPLLTVPDSSGEGDSWALVLLITGEHLDGSQSEALLTDGCKAFALGYLPFETADERIGKPRLHFHLLRVANGGRITLEGSVTEEFDSFVDGAPACETHTYAKRVVYLCQDGVMSSESDVRGATSLDELEESWEAAQVRSESDEPLGRNELQHRLDRTGFFHVDDLVAHMAEDE